MRTIFLIGILGVLIVIATKRNDQTAIDAAFEMGNKAKNIVTEFENGRAQNTQPLSVKESKKSPPKEIDPFIRQTIKALENAQSKLPKKYVEVKPSMQTKYLSPSIDKKKDDEVTTAKNPSWVIPKPKESTIPEIPATPKAVVQKANLGEGTPLELANADPAPVDVGKSYDLVKGYYENASRLLEGIK
jgi:hypothetical protein